MQVTFFFLFSLMLFTGDTNYETLPLMCIKDFSGNRSFSRDFITLFLVYYAGTCVATWWLHAEL